MYLFSYGPAWFSSITISIDIFSVVVLIMAAIFSFKYYLLDRSKIQRLWLSLSFLFMAASFVAKLATFYALLIFRSLGARQVNDMAASIGSPVKGVHILEYVATIGIPFFLFLHLLGLFLLLLATQKQSSPKENLILIVLSFLLVVYVSDSTHFVFHFAAFFLALLIAYRYVSVYLRNKRKQSLVLAGVFGLICTTQIMFAFASSGSMLYVVAELLQLLAYIGFLIIFIAVLQHVKKK